jgi:hypothetical protein
MRAESADAEDGHGVDAGGAVGAEIAGEGGDGGEDKECVGRYNAGCRQ